MIYMRDKARRIGHMSVDAGPLPECEVMYR